MAVPDEVRISNQFLQLLAIETGQAASRHCLYGDDIGRAQENGNLAKELARVELLQLPALSHDILHHLQQAFQNDEKSRILALAYDPISAFHTDICSLLRECVARGLIQGSEERNLRQFCRSDHVVVSRLADKGSPMGPPMR